MNKIIKSQKKTIIVYFNLSITHRHSNIFPETLKMDNCLSNLYNIILYLFMLKYNGGHDNEEQDNVNCIYS